MVNALVAANKQFETYFYPNRNHGILRGNTPPAPVHKMTEFLDENSKTKGNLPSEKKILKTDKPEKLPLHPAIKE